MHDVVRHDDPGAFLDRAERWLLLAEDRHNLILSLAYALAGSDETPGDALFATVESDGAVVGCAVRTPPHKLLVTDLPAEACAPVAGACAEAYDELPGVLGPAPVAEAIAMTWVALRGGGWRPGLEQGIYRLDAVTPPVGVSGTMRVATRHDVDLAAEWGEGFARDSGVHFPTRRDAVERWIEAGSLHLWHDDGPRSIAVARGRTPHGVRIGYVYTPPEHRGRGYASALVARLSQKALDGGVDFCVLYTDLSNPVSNGIYRRLGYELLAEVRDYDLVAEGAAP